MMGDASHPGTSKRPERAGRRFDRWQHLTTSELAAIVTEATVAVLPVAAVEAHGPHLPLGTDAIINAGILASAGARFGDGHPVLILPELSVGHSLEHTAFPGTLSATAETLLALWTDVGRGVAAAGVRRLVLFNSHGGQRALVDLTALRLRAECGLLVVRADWFALGAPDGLFAAEELAFGLHGGEVETSLMLALRPDLVRLDQARDFQGLPARLSAGQGLLGAEVPVGFGWMSQDLHPAGVCGHAARADAPRGARLLDYLGERLAALLREVAAFPLDRLGEAAGRRPGGDA